MPTPRQTLIKVPESVYSSRFGTARQMPYQVRATEHFTLTSNQAFYQIQEQMPKDQRMSTAAEELAKQLEIEGAGQYLTTSALFDDLFGKGSSKRYIYQWTSTGLRVPAGMDVPKSYREVIDGKTHELYYFIVLVGGKEVGEALVPLGGDRPVTSWNKVHGIPRTTTDEELRYHRGIIRWFVKLNPTVDPISGKRDVAVGRWCGWRYSEYGGWLDVGANIGRSDSRLNGGFRPVVRGR